MGTQSWTVRFIQHIAQSRQGMRVTHARRDHYASLPITQAPEEVRDYICLDPSGRFSTCVFHPHELYQALSHGYVTRVTHRHRAFYVTFEVDVQTKARLTQAALCEVDFDTAEAVVGEDDEGSCDYVIYYAACQRPTGTWCVTVTQDFPTLCWDTLVDYGEFDSETIARHWARNYARELLALHELRALADPELAP